ncbi:MAG: S9 family peptidase [Candidatus Eisenbacteria bacterium]
MPKKTPVVPSDLYLVRMPNTCRLSPGGDRLLVSVSSQSPKTLRTETRLWALDPFDSARPELRPFTQEGNSDRAPAWSPDGSRVAFLSSRSGSSEIWIMDSDGGEARRLTTLDASISEFVWHPSGRWIIAGVRLKDTEAKERERAKKRGDAGADEVRVRHIERLVYKIDGAGYLPKNRTHIWKIDAQTGRANALTKDDQYDESNLRVSPNGRWVYFTSNRSKDPDLEPLRDDLCRIAMRGGNVEVIPTFAGPVSEISLSPDGEWVAFLGRPEAKEAWNQRHTKLYVVRSEGGRPVELTASLDRGCSNSAVGDIFGDAGTPTPRWSPDGQWIYFIVANEGNQEIWRVSPKQRRPESVVADTGVIADFDIDFATGRVFYTMADPTQPGELFERRLPPSSSSSTSSAPSAGGLGDAVRRSSLNTEWLTARRVAEPEVVWFEGKGKHPVQGWVLLPLGARRDRKHPGVLYIHGGPGAQYTNAFFHEFQVLAARGFIVFYANPRGGTGYSERHLNCIVGRWGTYDYEDLMKFTDVVTRRYRMLDRKRLAVAGGSYGGFMTNWIIGHTQRFRCAITQRSISNWLSFLGASDFGPAWTREFGFVQPWKNPMHYLRRSPLFYLDKMKTPTLIEHQEEDHRCPIDQGEQLWSALKSKGVPCEFVRYPAEPHGMSRMGRPDRRIDRIERISAWLDRWLNG